MKVGAKNPTLPMVSIGEIPYASQAFYTLLLTNKVLLFQMNTGIVSGYWHMFTFLLEHNIRVEKYGFYLKK